MTGELPDGLIARASDAASAAVGYLADLFARMLNGIAMLTPLALLSGGSDEDPSAHQAPPVAAVVTPAPPVDDTPKEPQPIGEFDVTFYFVASEEDVTAAIEKREREALADAGISAEPGEAADGTGTELAAVAPVLPPREIVPLYEQKTCNVLAEVDKEFAKSLALQGTGRLKDGRLLNVAARENCDCERKPCYHEIENQQWGKTGTGRTLQPFRTVAVDPTVITLNYLHCVPLLAGRTMPGRPPWGGFVHDGCVVADDTGGGIQGYQIDLFVGRKGYYVSLAAPGGSHAWARHVQVFDGAKRCERKGRRIGRKAASI